MKLKKKVEVLVLDSSVLDKENLSKLEKINVIRKISKSDVVIFNVSLSDDNKNLPLFIRISNMMNVQNFGVVSMPFKFEGKIKNEFARKVLFDYVFDDAAVINSDEVIEEIPGKISMDNAIQVIKSVRAKNTNIVKYYFENNLSYTDLKSCLLMAS